MTIGFDGSRVFVEGRTGTENYSFQLLKHLSLIDTENRYLIYIKKSQKSKVKSQNWPENFKFIEIGLPRLWTQLGLAFRTFIDPLDVLFVPSHTLPLIRRPGLKTVITVHDLGAEFLPAFHQLKQVLYLKLMTHYQLRTASQIIAVSEATKNDIEKRVGISEAKIKVIHEGVEKEMFKPIPKDIVDNIVKKYDVVRGKYFLFVGTIQPRKNLEKLIRAFNLFLGDDKKDYKLVLVGGRGWKSVEIYELPKKLGIEGNVKFLGRVSDDELVALYNGALALTYPSLFEGFGLPILEAYGCGCPVITSNISSMAEVAGSAAIQVNPYNIEEIFKAMQKITSDDIFRSSLIKKGILGSEEFSWQRCAEETLKVLEAVNNLKLEN